MLKKLFKRKPKTEKANPMANLNKSMDDYNKAVEGMDRKEYLQYYIKVLEKQISEASKILEKKKDELKKIK